MSAERGLVSAAVSAERPAPRSQLRARLGTAAFWLLGSAAAVLAQPSSDRRLAAAGAAAAGIVTILVVSRLTPDPGRRYFRSIVATVVSVSVVGDWLVQHLVGANGFVAYGFDTRIALPLIFVLATPLVLQELPVRLRSRALWRDRALIVREAQPLDWLAAAYALLIVPDLLLGLAHHTPKSYIAQDLGLIVFFVFAYIAGRVVKADAGRALAAEFSVVLLVLGGIQAVVNLDTTPLFTYVDAACTGAVAFALLQWKKSRALLLCISLALLANEAHAVKQGASSTTAIELAGALAIIAYLVIRARHLVPQWLLLGISVVVLAGFFAFTSDGAGVTGRYYGTDPSKAGRTYEADAVRRAVHSSPVSFVFGRGLGGNIDETGAPRLFAESLAYGGRDLAHVQEVHLLPYEFLLKYGLLGFAWLAAFVAAVVILGVRALERASRQRDPTLVIYAALPLLGIVEALAAATHLQDNPLNALALGVLVTRLGPLPSSRVRLGLAIPAAAVICAVVGGIAFHNPPPAYTGPGPDLLNVPLPKLAQVGDVRFNYPPGYHHRYFATAVGGHGGVVVASYPLKRSPQLGGSGQTLRKDAVFFELYELPRRGRYVAPKKNFPLTIFDFTTAVGSLRNAPSTEQGGVVFRVNGRNYRAILWVGKDAPKKALIVVDELTLSIRIS